MKFKADVKALILVHTVMLMVQIIFAGLIYATASPNKPTLEGDASKILQGVAAVLAVGGGFAAFFLFKKRMVILQETATTFTEKINHYRAASIVKYALLEAPSLFCVIGYILTHNISFLLLSIVVILVFAGQKPTVNMMMYDMNVTRDELFEQD